MSELVPNDQTVDSFYFHDIYKHFLHLIVNQCMKENSYLTYIVPSVQNMFTVFKSTSRIFMKKKQWIWVGSLKTVSQTRTTMLMVSFCHMLYYKILAFETLNSLQ